MSEIEYVSREDSPIKVDMIDHTKNPINAIFQGIDIMNSDRLDDKAEAVIDLQNTGLRGALEHAYFEFKIKNVTRAFTHQMVRYRHMSFSQESMRFVKKNSPTVRIPPNIEGDNSRLATFMEAVENSFKKYDELLEDDVPQQDARAVLPIHTCTSIIFSANFRSLVNMAETRLCRQAQHDEWDEFLHKMKGIIDEDVRGGHILNKFLKAICFRTKQCEFEGMLDRECPLQEKWEDYNESE